MSVGREPGPSNVLTGETPIEDVTVATGIDGLDFIPSGTLPPNPSELLGTDRFQTLLQALDAQYDRIMLDSPPVLAVADTAVLAQRIGAAIMVIRAGQTGRESVVEGLERV